MRINFIILVCIFICPFEGETTEMKTLPITYNAKISSFLVVEAVEDIPAGRPLGIINISSPNTAEQVLAKYYWLLKNAKFDDAAKLYSINDGSQFNFIKAIEDKSINFDRFVSIAEININHIKRWNSFVYFWGTYKDYNGRKRSFRQELNCITECRLVFNKASNISVVNDLLELNLFAYKTLKDKKYQLPDSNELKNFTKVTIKHPQSYSDANNAYPMSFYLNIDTTYKDKIVKRDSDCQSTYKDRLESSVCHFLNKFRSINVLDPQELSKFMSEIRGRPYEELISLNSFFGNKIKNKRYQPKTFVQWVNNWSSVKLLGSIENDATYFLFFLPEIDDGIEGPMQIVTFDKESDPNYSKVIYGSNDEDTYAYFHNGLFINELSLVINK